VSDHAHRLVVARFNKGYSQRELAVVAGVSLPTVQRLENGLMVYPANAKKVADAVDLQVTDILDVEQAA